ncbi:MAG: FtsX-like permease family protein [Candidatus Lokiarchaeota archaeon]|nr:FtsX-like permease family protein [Candidatus Lokiarchaeota archaeon]MBD3340104.1 FtsX-like permease family protein [Candidatus Lokiarchaeota archaeon]
MVNLTINDLFHKKLKLVLIIVGLTVSLFLIQYSAGMWNGVLTRCSSIIDKWDHDVWIRDEDNEEVFGSGYLDDEIYDKIKNLKEIEEINRLIYDYSRIETDEEIVECMILGFELSSEEVEPWDIVKGNVDNLKDANTVIVDVSLKDIMEETPKMGDKLTIGDVEVEIVGFCKNSRWMNTPFIWGSLETMRKTAPWAGNWSNTYAIKLAEDASIDDLEASIEEVKDVYQLKDMEILSSDELRQNSYDFVVNEGGMGGSIYILVFMGFFVGMIIISISTYQTVQEKIPEFGTLKAIGASKGFLNKMLIGQVLILVSVSFWLATLLTYVLGLFSQNAVIPIIIHLPTTFLFYGLTIITSVFCSLIAIRKVHKIDPAVVFQG